MTLWAGTLHFRLLIMTAIETASLVKTFGATRALDGVDLAIREGSVYGILGPNGAGKTTAIRVLTTLLKPTSGRALVLGHDVAREAAAVRRKVSLTGQYASVDEDLTGHENLVLVSRLMGLAWSDAKQRATELLDAFGLSDAAGKQVRTYSGGMRRCIGQSKGYFRFENPSSRAGKASATSRARLDCPAEGLWARDSRGEECVWRTRRSPPHRGLAKNAGVGPCQLTQSSPAACCPGGGRAG